ncbi:porin family protein [Salinimicrobium xinjiangense]|uniref:porin family protein n=1 Tax=Salinimicrobium xinjiangense TaxID=438596 RepID=UPI0003FD4540|nr:porin family protein [Salinimicrobium xinjiangense]
MKKIFFLAVLVCATAMNAQQLDFGAKAGVNFANLTGDDVDDIDGRTSFHVGLVSEFNLSERFAIQPEVLYSSQGAEDEDITWKLDYVSIPIMAKFFVTEGFSLHAGPYLAFNVVSEVESEGISVDLADETESVDFGAALGLGYELPMGLFFQGRYAMGLSDISSEGDAKNGVFQLSVGFMF